MTPTDALAALADRHAAEALAALGGGGDVLGLVRQGLTIALVKIYTDHLRRSADPYERWRVASLKNPEPLGGWPAKTRGR